MFAARWGWLLVVVTAACGVADALVLRANGISLFSAVAVGNGFPGINLAALVGALVGVVILSRHPRHPIGWLFCLGQLGVALGLLTGAAGNAVASGALLVPPGVGAVSAWLGELLGVQFALVLLGCLLLLAPDGHLLSHRWRPVLLLLVGSYTFMGVVLVLFFPPGTERSANDMLANVANGAIIAVALGLVLSAVSLVLRLRRSAGETRQQLRWIAVAAGLLAAVPIVALTLNLSGRATPIWLILALHLAYLGVPVATGMAVMRYRLYDVDRIIGGSVVLAVLLVLGGAGYVVVVALSDNVVPGELSSTWSSLAIFVAVVLIFQPIRRTVRRLADRVVHGPASMSYEALTSFTRELAASATTEPFLAGVAEAAARLVSADRCLAAVIFGASRSLAVGANDHRRELNLGDAGRSP
jgi:hypothetical protein